MTMGDMLRRVSSFLMVILFCCFGSASYAQEASSSPSATSGSSQYLLGAGDKVRLIVFGEPTLGGEFTVSGDGKISLPLIGTVDAVGLTAVGLQETIAARYRAGYLNDPRVNIEVLNFRPFYILGEVSKPGEYPYSDGITVLNAVALAQGFTYRANQKKVYIRHANTEKEISVPLSSSLRVEPGDTVRITERYF